MDSTSHRFLQRELPKDGIHQEKRGIQGMEWGVSHSGEYGGQQMLNLIVMWLFYVNNVKVGLAELLAIWILLPVCDCNFFSVCSLDTTFPNE